MKQGQEQEAKVFETGWQMSGKNPNYLDPKVD